MKEVTDRIVLENETKLKEAFKLQKEVELENERKLNEEIKQ